jgi:hypothetical protein
MKKLSQSTIDWIQMFSRVFRGRTDVIAKWWKTGGRSGYSPICENLWKKGICCKPCRDCGNASYTPVSVRLLYEHLAGGISLGIYPLLPDGTCNFIAADFDNHSGKCDVLSGVKALYAAGGVLDLPCYVIRSRSGAGYHVYLFFEPAVPAWKARSVMIELLKSAGVGKSGESSSGFDRLFPNQDELPPGGLGNLIALPFQGKAANKKNTLFQDPGTGFLNPYDDQAQVLKGIVRVSEEKLDSLVDKFNLVKPEADIPSCPKVDVGSVMECEFLKFCKESPERVKEPLWYAMISNLASIRPGGYSLCHALSKGYPGYDKIETDKKIHQAIDSSRPHTCRYIYENGFECRKSCNVKTPFSLVSRSEQLGNGPA